MADGLNSTPEPDERVYEPPRAEDVSADEPTVTASGFVTGG